MSKQIRNSARLIFGLFFGVIGVIGFILPLVPGTPFLLIAAACFNSMEEEELVTKSANPSPPNQTSS
ncbi:YbaN family protein [Candidatus Synechococcus calcipolaris G9]|uniref:YbaN family protein n=1 Tax=Candidatus Synechococcus calcipolaris G9 TaxID=1497997 RepID=A0ABT6EYB2_9SYNE|nr:DUF454 family protein [Candidatus Synechococcus calcipolaris]MDG2990548.1 YbaN family protein [Candidatus Synechococcus calcipolaris G9]